MAIRIGRRRSGGVSIMSHPVNDEILENLYEEALEYVTKKNKYQFDSNQKELEDAAAFIAKQWFEERCQ